MIPQTGKCHEVRITQCKVVRLFVIIGPFPFIEPVGRDQAAVLFERRAEERLGVHGLGLGVDGLDFRVPGPVRHQPPVHVRHHPPAAIKMHHRNGTGWADVITVNGLIHMFQLEVIFHIFDITGNGESSAH